MRHLWVALLIPVLLSGCSNQKKLAEDEAQFNEAMAAQQARLDREVQDATVKNMLLRGAMPEHTMEVFYECRDAESKTPTCRKLNDRVAKWGKKMDAEEKARLKSDGVTP